MRTEELTGKIHPDQSWLIEPPQKASVKAAMQDEKERSGDSGTYLRVRKDIRLFSQAEHECYGAGQALVQLAADKAVMVTIGRPVVKGHAGQKQGSTQLRIPEGGVMVANLDMAMGILQRYKTSVEEVPEGEIVLPADPRDAVIADLEKRQDRLVVDATAELDARDARIAELEARLAGLPAAADEEPTTTTKKSSKRTAADKGRR